MNPLQVLAASNKYNDVFAAFSQERLIREMKVMTYSLWVKYNPEIKKADLLQREFVWLMRERIYL